MPTLRNPRHELFAQELAKGKTADEAYQLAGYKANDGNCIRLKGNERIAARTSELLNVVAAKTEITVESLTRMFLEDRDLARRCEQTNAAVAAVAAIGKLHGKFIDRKEIGQPGDFSAMNDAELMEEVISDLEDHGADPDEIRQMLDTNGTQH